MNALPPLVDPPWDRRPRSPRGLSNARGVKFCLLFALPFWALAAVMLAVIL